VLAEEALLLGVPMAVSFGDVASQMCQDKILFAVVAAFRKGDDMIEAGTARIGILEALRDPLKAQLTDPAIPDIDRLAVNGFNEGGVSLPSTVPLLMIAAPFGVCSAPRHEPGSSGRHTLRRGVVPGVVVREAFGAVGFVIELSLSTQAVSILGLIVVHLR
jgi:hypothetical protein